MISFQGSIAVTCPKVKDQEKLESVLKKVNPDIKKQIEQSDVDICFYKTGKVTQAFVNLYSGSHSSGKYFEQGLLQTQKGFVKHVLKEMAKYIKSS